MPEIWQSAGFGLYLHWPFCLAKCPYCDFNSHVSAEIDQERWLRAYVSEIQRYAAETGGRVLGSVFFGGGTPSLMDPDLVHGILDAIRQSWTIANDFEVTLEANPTSVEASRFSGYRQAGVNRISLGVQALNDTDLKALGRLHNTAEAMSALEIARSDFDRVSFDLIYARQHQTESDWRAELKTALSMAPDHISLYQLTIEDGTAFGDRFLRGRLPGLPDEDLGADLYQITQDLCREADLVDYEVSNHANPGSESRHNLIYWRSGDFLGIGPGAHGRLSLGASRYATETPPGPIDWLRAVELDGCGETERQAISAGDLDVELLMMGLRIREGVDRRRLSGRQLKLNNINYLTDLGLITATPERLMVTDRGRPVLNSVLRSLLSDEG